VGHRHAPDGYVCQFCRISAGDDGILTTQSHVVLRDADVTAFVASHWWPANPGHVLVIPNMHVENIYEIPHALGTPLLAATQRIALAFKRVDDCDGVSTRQHNEPAGNQDVWHYHQHVFPRFAGDRLYERHREKALAPEQSRAERAHRLRDALGRV
jgi:histidine triad (HIT) family protein